MLRRWLPRVIAPAADDLSILALHGAGMTGRAWQCLSPLIDVDFFKTLDLPGHGDGKSPLTTIADMAAHVMAHLPSQPVILMGHSMGALVALETAARAGTAVAALVLMSAAATMPVNAALLEKAKHDPAAAAALVMKWSLPRMRADDAELLAQVAAAQGGNLALHADLLACDRYADGVQTAQKITCPVLVIGGTADKMTPPESVAGLAKIFLHGSYAAIDGAGHMPMIEDAPAVARIIEDFLDKNFSR